MSAAKHIGVIIGSTRVNGIGPHVAEYVKTVLETEKSDTILSLVSIASFKLPVFDEPVLPAMVPDKAQFVHEHSKAWSAEIGKYDAYIIVTPEYNFGLPGGIKNAIDYLYNTWIGKPVLIVSYGIKGGSVASDHLKKTLEGMHLQVVETRPQLEFPGADPTQHNMSPSLMAAMGGVLAEPAKEAWVSKKDELLKGFGELKQLLTKTVV